MDLGVVDATELAELAGFLREGAAADHERLNASLQAFTGEQP